MLRTLSKLLHSNFHIALYNLFMYLSLTNQGGAVASWLVLLTLDWVVWVRVLAEDIVLCSWALYSHGAETPHPGVTLRWTSIPSRKGGVVKLNTPSRFMLQKPEISASLMGLLGS